MANLLKDYYYFAHKIVWLRIDGLRLKWAIYMANTKQKAYNKRFFLQTKNINYRYIAMMISKG